FSSSLIVGSLATSASNCSSGTSARTFLPSGPTIVVSAWICSAVLAVAFFAGDLPADFWPDFWADFWAGAFAPDLPVAFVVAFFAVVAEAFFAGALFWVAFVDELEDTNYLSIAVFVGRIRFMGAAEPVPVNQPRAHSVT